MDPDYSDFSQDDLIIQILEFVCKNKHLSAINAALIQRDLFPVLDENEILHLIEVISYKRIQQLDIVKGNHLYLKYRIGLEDYVKNIKKMTKKEKLHRIVEFLSVESKKLNKSSFVSNEIAKAFNPELSISEVNSLCRIIVDNGDLKSWSDKDLTSIGMLGVIVIVETHDAYHNKKYLEEDEQVSIPFNQNIITGDNIIMGNVSGTVTQEDNATVTTEAKRIPWLKVLYWIIGILVGLTIIITFIKSIL